MQCNVGRFYGTDESSVSSLNECHNSIPWEGQTHKISRPLTNKSTLLECLEQIDKLIASGEATVEDIGKIFDIQSERDKIHSWTEFLKMKLHPQSTHILPPAVHAQTFDTYFSGFHETSDCLPKPFYEDISETIRFFAEECDRLSCINVLCDFQAGYTGLCCSVLQDIRQDFGSSIALPVWASIDDRTDKAQAHAYMHMHMPTVTEGSLRNNLQTLTLPMTYANITEYSSCVIPISIASASNATHAFISPSTVGNHLSTYESSAIIATAMETATSPWHLSCPLDSSNKMNPQDWLSSSTVRGRFPVCFWEARLPFPLRADQPYDTLWDTFKQYDHGMNTYTLNPFMSSLSPRRGFMSSPSSKRSLARITARSKRAYCNNIFTRGDFQPDFRSNLFAQCFDSRYMVTTVKQFQTPIRFPVTFPSRIFQGVDSAGHTASREADISSACTHCSSAVSVGTDELVGYYIQSVLSDWTRATSSKTKGSATQLEKINIGPEDCDEIVERLTNLMMIYEIDTKDQDEE